MPGPSIQGRKERVMRVTISWCKCESFLSLQVGNENRGGDSGSSPEVVVRGPSIETEVRME